MANVSTGVRPSESTPSTPRDTQLTPHVHTPRGLDSRYMISRLQPPNVRVLSLTTIATPHRGSAFADYLFRQIGPMNLPHLYKALAYFGLETGAFEQLTMKYMAESFNPRTPDVDGIAYYSYGATLRPRITSVFRKSHSVMQEAEGPNDGLVSVSSAKWGTYKGTLDDVSHLDLINWTNKLRWWIWELTGHRKHFNAIAFYLAIAGPRDTRQVDVRPGPAVGLARQDGLRWAREDWPFEWKVLGEGDGYPPALMGDEKGAAPQLSLAEAGKVSVVATQSLLLARLGTTCYSSRGGEQGNAQILARPGSATEEEWCRHSWQTSRQTFRMRM
ncbi:lipase 2 [Friedmanniomyces endolithicus]|nr:lipase 2 [Friedmanniomyces endolithicus]